MQVLEKTMLQDFTTLILPPFYLEFASQNNVKSSILRQELKTQK